jgi:hypothetical protein
MDYLPFRHKNNSALAINQQPCAKHFLAETIASKKETRI